jgi:hypothetical protein
MLHNIRLLLHKLMLILYNLLLMLHLHHSRDLLNLLLNRHHDSSWLWIDHMHRLLSELNDIRVW